LLGGNPLEAAMAATVAYFDVFACAPTAAEIHRFLMGTRASRAEVEAALVSSPELSRVLGTHEGYWFLEGKEHLALRRRRFQRHSATMWPKARRIAQLIERTGLASSGMVTGSLAADNADEHADIDFLFTYPAERTWTSYALVRVVAKMPLFDLKALCPNYALSDTMLEIKPQNLFTAWEIAKSVPMFGFDVYASFVRANAWVSRYLPNALPDVGPALPAREAGGGVLSRIAKSGPYRWLEAKERARKFSSDRRDIGIDMNERQKQGSMDRHSPTRSFHTLSEVRYRLEQLGLQRHPVYPELVAATKVLATEMKHWPANGAPAHSNGATLRA
jgi:hypothetical protein